MADDGSKSGAFDLANLRDHPERFAPGQRIALVRAEQRRLWASGEHATVEELLEQYSFLANDSEAIVDLVYDEFILRREIGENVDPELFCQRFPMKASAIRRQLQLHNALEQMSFSSGGMSHRQCVDPVKDDQPPSDLRVAIPPVSDVASAADPSKTPVQPPGLPSTIPTGPPADDVSVPGYDIISELGRGGMGVVYQARQHKLDRIVALKMILSGSFASQNDRARFQDEAIRLARVQHQNIVQVYEGSEHNNQPYIVMEYVGGGTLSKEISGQPLLPRIAARLILSLANAVQAAHDKGIIHRDLKPRNILLTCGGLREASERGESSNHAPASTTELQRSTIAKITDFGLAKALQGAEPQTVSGAILGTPSYMSPEQARGQSKSVGPAADIYALGAILYECLTGRPPFLTPNAIDTIYLVVHEEPVKPSASDPKVPQDLETICLKCLEKVPEKRYRSAKVLAEDLEAFLDNRPIKARPVGPIERAIKWAKRRPAQAALVGTIALAVVILLGLGAWVSEQRRKNLNEQIRLTKIADEQRDTAKARETATNAVLGFVEKEILAAARPKGKKGGQGYKVSLRDAVLAALPRVAASFSDQPLIEARLRRTLGTSFSYLGDPAIALEQFRRARDLYLAEVGPNHPNTLRSMNGVACSHFELGRHREALALNEQTLGLRKSTLGPYHADTLESMNNFALSCDAVGRHLEALTLHKEILELRKATLGPNAPDTLQSMNNLAGNYADLGRYVDAVTLFKETLERMKATLGPDDPDTFSVMNNLAFGYSALHRHEAALSLHKETLDLRKGKLGPDHLDTLSSMNNLSVSYSDVGRHLEAEALLSEAIAVLKRLARENPTAAEYQMRLANAFTNRSRARAARGQLLQAAQDLAAAGTAQASAFKLEPKAAAANVNSAMSHFVRNVVAGQTPGKSERARPDAEQKDSSQKGTGVSTSRIREN